MGDGLASAIANASSRQDQARNAGLDSLDEAIVARLTNLRQEYAAACAKVSQSRHDESLELRILNEVDRQHRGRRAPYLLQLSSGEENLLVRAQKARFDRG
jgi:hypothetical protein